MKLSFHGAAGMVTGSCHLLEAAGRRILVDCGLLQGSRELAHENADPFGFDAASIDTVLLTHAHLDHCGRLPLLMQRGFHGEIIATAPTRELTRLVLLDSARLQEEDAHRRAHHHRRHGEDVRDGALYTLTQALNSLDLFGKAARYHEPVELAPGLRATFLEAGHILGSASILVEFEEAGRARSVLFSGDLGGTGHDLLKPPAPPGHADIVVMESTYGDRLHRGYAESVEELYAAIADAFSRGGNVLIPTFALERAQELLFAIHAGVASGRLQRSVQVFLDSPMAISATEIFERHPEACGPSVAGALRAGDDPFHVPGLHFTHDASESMAINRIAGGAIIMAGSGMCTGGRIRHHLRHNLWRPDASVLFVGFAAQGTLARRIIDGARSVRVFDEDIPVRARIHTINGFSGHADQRQLLAWHGAIGAVQRTFLVHGEQGAMQTLAGKLGDAVTMPQLHQVFEV
jgi:metallo-beta-lactamase family protein